MIRLAFFVVAPIVALFAFGEGPQQDYVNAGVLPYSRESGEVRVLLGFDPGPGAWADFVGVCTPGETPSDTAAREFVEETREAYPANDVLTRLRSLEPVEIGPTRIFLLEVPEVPAARLNRLSKSRNSEKTNYCWVPLVALLESIDDRGANRAEVPASCGSSRELFDLVGANLAQGHGLRQQLLTPPSEQTTFRLTTRPRCGR